MMINSYMIDANSLPNPGAGFRASGKCRRLRESLYFWAVYTILVILVIGLFAVMLFLQFTFRVKVLKAYRELVRSRVQFQAGDLFRPERLAEVKRRYPQRAVELQAFADHLKTSVKLASVLIALITVFGAILMYFR